MIESGAVRFLATIAPAMTGSEAPKSTLIRTRKVAGVI